MPSLGFPSLLQRPLLSQQLLTGSLLYDSAVSTARQTISIAALTSGSTTTGATSVATASISPTTGRYWQAAITHRAATAANQPTLTGCNLTWTVVETLTAETALRRTTVFQAQGGTPSSGALTFDFAGQTQTSFVWSVIEVTNTNATTALVQSDSVEVDAAVSGNTTLTLAAFEHVNNINLTFVSLSTNATVTPDADFAELTDNAIGADAHTLESQWAVNQVGVTPTWAATPYLIIISSEIKAG